MNTIIPTIAHAVRHPIHRDSELSLYIERPKAEKAVGFFGGVLIDLIDRAEHERVVQELSRQCDELAARLEAAEAPVLEVRACGCSQAKAGRCVMGDYGALPIGTQLYAGAAPERAEPQPRPTCSSSGLLGASSGVGRECDYWVGGVCTSPEPCQHQQPVKPCRTCGPDGCPDSVACPKGGAA